jgi:hypothetical protein
MIWLIGGAALIVVGVVLLLNAGGSADAVVRGERRWSFGPDSWVSNSAGRWAGFCLMGMGAILLAGGVKIVF